MTAEKLMRRKFETVHAEATLEEVERKLEASGADLIPVCREGLLVGTITHHDVALGVSAGKRRAESPLVAEAIAADILFCFEGTDVAEAAKLMRESGVSVLPVLNRGKKIVGVLALKDILEGRSPGEAS